MTARIAVLGSANMDVVAVTERMPKVGETLTGIRAFQVPGGKGANQALAAARAGASVRMLGAVGDDAFGAAIRDVLTADGVDVAGLTQAAEPTGTAHILVDADGDNHIVVVPGANGTVELTDAHRAAIADADVLLLQLEIPLATVVAAAAHATAVGTTVVLTPAPAQELPPDLLADVDLLVPNEHEVALLTGCDDVADGARRLLAAGVGEVVVTLGSRGCLHAGSDGLVEVPAPTVAAVDTTAAGDTFTGCLATARAEGRPLREALRWAVTAAAISVTRSGASTSMPTRAEIDAAVEGVAVAGDADPEAAP